MEVNYEVASYSITMLRRAFGWIELLDSDDRPVGYIYLTDQAGTDHFGAVESDHPYVVTHQPPSMWGVVLDILRNEKPLFIRGVEPVPGAGVSAFFGTNENEPVGEGEK